MSNWPPVYLGSNQVISDIVDKINGGSSFPASPATGTTYFRTDLGWLCYFDGTRWLTCHDYSVTFFDSQQGISDINLSSTFIEWTRIRSDYSKYFTRVAIQTYVETTNNVSNYWTVYVYGFNQGFTASDAIYSLNTSGDTAGGWINHEGNASNNIVSNQTNVAMEGFITAGAPGKIHVLCTVYYKLIVT